MEELNDITFWKFVKLHWRLVVLAILFPLIIQLISIIPNNLTHLFDEPSKWTEVWAGYGGALLSAGIALVILYKQHKQNHEENEANRKQNELQNKMNLNLQINALKYQQKYNWYLELKHALTDLLIACDFDVINKLIDDVYYYLEDISGTDESKIESSINKRIFEIKSYHSSFYCLLSKEEKKELIDELKILDKDLNYYYGILNNLRTIIIIMPDSRVKAMAKEEMPNFIDHVLASQKKELEKLDEYDRLSQKIILKEYLEKYNYDFYGNSRAILDSMFEDFKNNVKSMGNIADDILQNEQNKIDKLLDVEEIKKNLNAN